MITNRTSLFLILSVLLVLPACGDDGTDGSFVTVFGAQNRTFSIEAGDRTVTCKKTPCTSTTLGCGCTCNCSTGTETYRCKSGCINTCDTECANVCLAKKGTLVSASGDCPAKTTGCVGSGVSFEAASAPGSNAGQYFRFLINKLSKTEGSEQLSMDFGKDGLNYKVEVGFPVPGETGKSYGYNYGYGTRTDTQTKYNTRCQAYVSQSSNGTQRYYNGTLACIMLWATDKSKDYRLTPLNNYVDLFARFSCEALDTSK